MSTIHIVIADDHPLMRAALKEAVATRFPSALVTEASTVAQLIDLLESRSSVDAILLDLKMPDAQGFSVLVRLRARFPDVPVVIVSATEEPDAVERALLLGASGYIVKSAPVETVGAGLRDVLDGRIIRPCVRPDGDAFAPSEVLQFRKLRTLTPQQFNVLVMIAEGHSNKTVANRLQISESTVKSHITGILSKLGLQRRTQAAVLAQRALQLRSVLGDDAYLDDVS